VCFVNIPAHLLYQQVFWNIAVMPRGALKYADEGIWLL
jgi:hypothetical protein